MPFFMKCAKPAKKPFFVLFFSNWHKQAIKSGEKVFFWQKRADFFSESLTFCRILDFENVARSSSLARKASQTSPPKMLSLLFVPLQGFYTKQTHKRAKLEMKHKVSAVLIVMNEAAILENTLRALQWCDEIVVVDSGSTDGTVALCEQYGCKVFYKAFEGFGEQKRFAVAQAEHEWILSIDADEVLSEGLQTEIQAALAQPHIAEAGFYLPRTLIFWGEKIRSEYKVPCLRLFHRQKGEVTPDKVHETIKVSGEIGSFKNPIWHDSYRSIHDYFHKFNKYTTLAAQEIFHKKKGKGKWLIVVRLPITFCQLFFLRGCFLNGFGGFMWSLFSAFYPVVKYIKVLELERKAAKEKPN